MGTRRKALIKIFSKALFFSYGLLVLGSMAEVFPGVPAGPELIVCLITLAAGFAAIQLLARREMKNTSSSER